MDQNFAPSYNGALRNHRVEVPECISSCRGIRIFGRLLKSVIFSTDVATIANTNADAVIAVYPFTPQPRIVSAVMSVADMPVFFGVGGGFTSGKRSVNQAVAAENMGAIGVVLNAPVPPEVLREIKENVDIAVVATIVSAAQDTEARIDAGVDILNVAASSATSEVVSQLRARHPHFPIMATGGPSDDTIRATIAAGADAISYTPPDNRELLAAIMRSHRERYISGD
ncbi:MAG: hydrolase [Oscillospiraceae bacterium]|nr:hydrolase [Oscillospiraceae bacterium]